jgi:hypothetical protein
MLKSNSVLEAVKKTAVKKAVKKTAVKKVVKKVVTRKPLTEAQKIASAKKRSENQQFANVQSAKRKTENAKFKSDAKANLLEVKRTTLLTNVDLSKSKNVEYLNECKKAINVILKSDELMQLTIEAVRTAKGNFVTYYFEQLIQKIVKLKMNKNLTFEVSLQGIISAKKIA